MSSLFRTSTPRLSLPLPLPPATERAEVPQLLSMPSNSSCRMDLSASEANVSRTLEIYIPLVRPMLWVAQQTRVLLHHACIHVAGESRMPY